MQTPITWKTEAGAVHVLPGRGRVLNIEIGGHHALWQSNDANPGWCIGGERLWIGPEADWYWQRTDSHDFKNYRFPKDFDPDNWSVRESRDGYFEGTLEVNVACAHRDAHLAVRLTRSVELLPSENLAAPVRGIGLRTCTSIEILGGTHGQPTDFWSLLQIPFSGSLLIPTVGKAKPRDHFDPCPQTEIAAHPTFTEIQIGGGAMFKLGISADDSAGRSAYVRQVPEGRLVLARTFPVHPELAYCDSPLADPGSQGDALQFFNDGGNFGNFGELEHRSPALRCGIGPQTFSEVSFTIVMLLSESAFNDWKMRWINS